VRDTGRLSGHAGGLLRHLSDGLRPSRAVGFGRPSSYADRARGAQGLGTRDEPSVPVQHSSTGVAVVAIWIAASEPSIRMDNDGPTAMVEENSHRGAPASSGQHQRDDNRLGITRGESTVHRVVTWQPQQSPTPTLREATILLVVPTRKQLDVLSDRTARPGDAVRRGYSSDRTLRHIQPGAFRFTKAPLKIAHQRCSGRFAD
jgi:hypothetical protein